MAKITCLFGDDVCKHAVTLFCITAGFVNDTAGPAECDVNASYAAFNKYARAAASQSVIKTIMHAVSSAHTCTYGHVYLSSGRINICTCKNTHSHTHSYPDSNILDISDDKSSLPHCRH